MISNCCKAEIKVICGDEGTGFNLCTKCQNSCDPYVKKQKKPEPKCECHCHCGKGCRGHNAYEDIYQVTCPHCQTNLDTKGWEQRWRLWLDDCIEDMESYTELPSNLSYQDELHKRLSEYGKAFIRQELSLAKQQWIEESVEGIGKKIKEIEMKEIPSNIAVYKHQDDAYKAGWNNALLFFRVHGLDDVLSYLKGGGR